MPEFDAASSDTTDPTKASVIATFSEAKKSGIERGRPTLRSTSAREAPSARKTSSSSGSIVASPVAMFTVIGKKQIRSEEHTSELQSLRHLVCRLLLEKKKKTN